MDSTSKTAPNNRPLQDAAQDLEAYAAVQSYLSHFPGLCKAISIGSKAVCNPDRYFTLEEFADTLSLKLTMYDMFTLENKMTVLVSTLMLETPAKMTTYLGSCSSESYVYPAAMFPLFLVCLEAMDLR